MLLVEAVPPLREAQESPEVKAVVQEGTTVAGEEQAGMLRQNVREQVVLSQYS